MKNIFRLLSLLVLTSAFSSCEKYNDFTNDYAFSAVYFATQKPLRTIVARDVMQIKFGATLAGKRENDRDEWVKFSIDPTLLTTVEGASQFRLLPAAYYTIGLTNPQDSTIVIPKGKFLGDLPITFNRTLFTADPLAVGNNYALPLRLTKTSADSILSGDASTPSKAYTIIVVKYIAPEHGNYYGTGTETDEAKTQTAYSVTISAPRTLKTLSLNEFEMSGLGNSAASATAKIKLVLAADRSSVAVQQATGGTAVTDLGSTYNATQKTFTLNYSFLRAGKTIRVSETMTLRQDPENDLRFEEW